VRAGRHYPRLFDLDSVAGEMLAKRGEETEE
jgi:hypothetical protein